MPTRPPATPVFFPSVLPVGVALPLRGLTVLAVEDSRFASEALRLMCQRSGARLRRADCLVAAASHLHLYRPDIMIVDLGLPDGRGEDLITGISHSGGDPGGPVVLGTSGDADGMTRAMRAGAAGYLAKPLPDLASFQAVILSHLHDRHLRGKPVGGEVSPDMMALCDDLRLAETALRAGPAPATRDWLRGFLAGLALLTGDEALRSAAEAISQAGDSSGARAIISEKIRQLPAFGPANAGRSTNTGFGGRA